MMTGVYPVDHGIRENGRRVSETTRLLAPALRDLGYSTAAFVSGFPLDSQFGLARGFDHYDDDFGEGRVERSAGETIDLALEYLEKQGGATVFLWVHLFDPHDPYEPPEPFQSRFAENPYLGEIAYMDEQIGRLVEGFTARSGSESWRILVVGDHGEGLGDHGENLHGNLLYQGVMRVPLIIAGSEIAPGVVARAVSVKQVFPTVLGWAGGQSVKSLLAERGSPVLAEAMKPFLQYGWQPQFMAVEDGVKIIRSGEVEVYDVLADPLERENLAGRRELEPRLREALATYVEEALRESETAAVDLDPEARKKLASLGYFDSTGRPALREDAPNPKEMTHLFHDLDVGASRFVERDYEQAISIFRRVLAEDPHNFAVALRLGVAHSVMGDQSEAVRYFEKAREMDSSSVDLRHYRAMHHMRYRQWELARPLFESVLVEMPERLPALEGLAQIYTRQGNLEGAAQLLERIAAIKESPGLELSRLGELRMAVGNTAGSIRAFEKSRDILGEEFTHYLELGVLYLADGRYREAATTLDQVFTSHPGYPMALFKRAQVSVLLDEEDRAERVRRAWAVADEATRPLIENEELFAGIPLSD